MRLSILFLVATLLHATFSIPVAAHTPHELMLTKRDPSQALKFLFKRGNAASKVPKKKKKPENPHPSQQGSHQHTEEESAPVDVKEITAKREIPPSEMEKIRWDCYQKCNPKGSAHWQAKQEVPAAFRRCMYTCLFEHGIVESNFASEPSQSKFISRESAQANKAAEAKKAAEAAKVAKAS